MNIKVNGRYIFNHAAAIKPEAKGERFRVLEKNDEGYVWIVMETGSLRDRRFSVREGRLQADCRPYAVNKGK